MNKLFVVTIILITLGGNVLSQTNNNRITLKNNNIVEIKQIIEKQYKNVSDIKIEKIFIETFNTYFSDPGYIEGVTILINTYCISLSFSSTTFNTNGTIKYQDDYQFIIPEKKYYIYDGKEVFFYKNNYHGMHFHGGSASIRETERWLLKIKNIIETK